MAGTFGDYLAVQGVVQKKEFGKFANSWGVSEKGRSEVILLCLCVCLCVSMCV